MGLARAISSKAFSIKEICCCTATTFSRICPSSLSCTSRASSFAVLVFSGKIKRHGKNILQQKMWLNWHNMQERRKDLPGFLIDFAQSFFPAPEISLFWVPRRVEWFELTPIWLVFDWSWNYTPNCWISNVNIKNILIYNFTSYYHAIIIIIYSETAFCLSHILGENRLCNVNTLFTWKHSLGSTKDLKWYENISKQKFGHQTSSTRKHILQTVDRRVGTNKHFPH